MTGGEEMNKDDITVQIQAETSQHAKVYEETVRKIVSQFSIPKHIVDPTEEHCMEALLRADKLEIDGDTEGAELLRKSVIEARKYQKQAFGAQLMEQAQIMEAKYKALAFSHTITTQQSGIVRNGT